MAHAASAISAHHGRGLLKRTRPPKITRGAATRAELEAAGRLDSMLGQVALLLAERMCEFDTGSGTAALSKELRAVMATAVQGAPAAADPVDELRARRDRKRGS